MQLDTNKAFIDLTDGADWLTQRPRYARTRERIKERLRVKLAESKLPPGLKLAWCSGASPPDNSCSPANKGTGTKTAEERKKAQRPITAPPEGLKKVKWADAAGQAKVDFTGVELKAKLVEKVDAKNNELKAERARLRGVEKNHPPIPGVKGPAEIVRANVNRIRREKADLDKQVKEFDVRRAFEKANPLATKSDVDREVARLLKTGITSQTRINTGENINGVYICKTTEGTLAYNKPVSECSTAFDAEGMTADSLADREVAAYELDKLLGYDLVPTTVMRTDGPAVDKYGNKGKGSLQLGVDGVNCAALTYSQRQAWANDSANQEAMAKMMVIDYVVANRDRHENNFKIGNNGDVDGKLYLIDNGFLMPDFQQGNLRGNLATQQGNKLDYSSPTITKGLDNLLSKRNEFDTVLEKHGFPLEQRSAFWDRVENVKREIEGGDVYSLMEDAQNYHAL